MFTLAKYCKIFDFGFLGKYLQAIGNSLNSHDLQVVFYQRVVKHRLLFISMISKKNYYDQFFSSYRVYLYILLLLCLLVIIGTPSDVKMSRYTAVY